MAPKNQFVAAHTYTTITMASSVATIRDDLASTLDARSLNLASPELLDECMRNTCARVS